MTGRGPGRGETYDRGGGSKTIFWGGVLLGNEVFQAEVFSWTSAASLCRLFFKDCNLCGHLQRCQMPDIENSRKNSRRRCRVGPGQTAGKTSETPKKQSKQLFFGCFGCFSGCLTGTLPSMMEVGPLLTFCLSV